MRGVSLALVALVAAVLAGASLAAGSATPRLAVVARGLSSPVDVVQAPGEPGRLYVVEQPGRVRVVERGRVRVTIATEVLQETVRQSLLSHRVEVVHVPIGRVVTEAPIPRQEGDVHIVPVLEEVLVVERRLMLKEEIHLRLVEGEEVVELPIERRVQRATVERVPAEPAAMVPADTAT